MGLDIENEFFEKSDRFWENVYKCEHEWDPDYLESISCGTPYCSGNRIRCIKCGIYYEECGCGFNTGYTSEKEIRGEKWHHRTSTQ